MRGKFEQSIEGSEKQTVFSRQWRNIAEFPVGKQEWNGYLWELVRFVSSCDMAACVE